MKRRYLVDVPISVMVESDTLMTEEEACAHAAKAVAARYPVLMGGDVKQVKVWGPPSVIATTG